MGGLYPGNQFLASVQRRVDLRRRAEAARMILADYLALPEKVDAKRIRPERIAPAPGHSDPVEAISSD
jgi:hypothetical protein